MPDITIRVYDGEFSAYLATPESGAGPGVVVVQEIFGVNRDMRGHCDRLAAQGYIALCPDLFWRQEPGVQLTDGSEHEWAHARRLIEGFDVGKGIGDLKDCVGFLRGVDGATGPVGTLGFCLGGKLVYLMACRTSAECNVSYYGVGLDELLAEAPHITTPTVLHVAEEDEYVPKDAQRRILEGLAGHPCVTIHTYPGCHHAFARQGGVHHDAEAARLAEERTAACFRMNLLEG